MAKTLRIRLRIFGWGGYPELSEYTLNAITGILIRKRQRKVLIRRAGRVTTETGVMQPQSKNAVVTVWWKK